MAASKIRFFFSGEIGSPVKTLTDFLFFNSPMIGKCRKHQKIVANDLHEKKKCFRIDGVIWGGISFGTDKLSC